MITAVGSYTSLDRGGPSTFKFWSWECHFLTLGAWPDNSHDHARPLHASCLAKLLWGGLAHILFTSSQERFGWSSSNQWCLTISSSLYCLCISVRVYFNCRCSTWWQWGPGCHGSSKGRETRAGDVWRFAGVYWKTSVHPEPRVGGESGRVLVPLQ